VHFEHAADLFLLVLDRVQVGALGERARIDADEGERADERIVHDLERERAERRIVGRGRLSFLVAVHLDALHVGNVERRRQIVDHGVEQRLHALVLERRTAQHRHERLVERALADQRLQRRDVGLVAFEIGFHRIVVLLDGKFDQLFAIFGSLVGQVGRDFLIEEFGAQRSHPSR
jgi:hypothetical protein